MKSSACFVDEAGAPNTLWRNTVANIPQDVLSAVAIANVKAIAEQPAMLSNLAYSNVVANTNLSQQNAVANQQSMNELGITVIARAATTIGNLGPDPLVVHTVLKNTADDKSGQTPT
jgi:hypothetical protein